jgi:SNF2 family DNA or RNA helicase
VAARKSVVAVFQAEDGPPFLVLSLKAGGTGLNLTAASHVIHFDRWWNPAVENQATDRAFRIGQTRHVLVHKLVTQGTIEERIAAMIADKQKLSDELLAGSGEIKLTELPDDQLLDLVRLDVNRAQM